MDLSGGAKRSDSRVGNPQRGLGRWRQAVAAILSALLVALPSTGSYGAMVFGDYAGYRFWQMSPDQIDWSGVNCVLHFAALPQSDGTLNLTQIPAVPRENRADGGARAGK